MKPKRFRPISAKIPDKMIEAFQKRDALIKQERYVELMVKRNKAATMGNKFKALVSEFDKRIAALGEV